MRGSKEISGETWTGMKPGYITRTETKQESMQQKQENSEPAVWGKDYAYSFLELLCQSADHVNGLHDARHTAQTFCLWILLYVCQAVLNIVHYYNLMTNGQMINGERFMHYSCSGVWMYCWWNSHILWWTFKSTVFAKQYKASQNHTTRWLGHSELQTG